MKLLQARRSWSMGMSGAAACIVAMAAVPADANDEIVSDGRVVATISSQRPLPNLAEVVLWTGERLPGALATTADIAGERELAGRAIPDDVVLWRHEALGVLALPFDSVSIVQLIPGASEAADPSAADGAGDLVVLVNGDRVRGIVTRLGEVVEVEPAEPDDPAREFLATDVERVSFVGTPASPGAVRYWLPDGTVVDAPAPGALAPPWQRRFATMPEGTSALLDRQSVQSLAQAGAAALGAAVDATRSRAAPPDAARPPRLESSGASSGVSRPLDAHGIWMDAPSTLEARMPFVRGVVSLVVRAQSPRVNGTLRIRQGDAVCAEVAVVGAAARGPDGARTSRDPARGIQVEATLVQGPFTIEFDAGSDGPLGDRLELRDGLLIKAGPEGEAAGFTGRRAAP